MSAERLRELAIERAREAHEEAIRQSQDYLGHVDDMAEATADSLGFQTCPHPDCLLVRSALGDTGRATPAALGCPKCCAVTVLTCPLCHNDSTVEQIVERATPASQPKEPPTECPHCHAHGPFLTWPARVGLYGCPECVWRWRPPSTRLSPEGSIETIKDLRAAVRAPSGEGRESQGCWFTRQQVSQVMDALESDADIDSRRAAFEMIQELHEPENLARQPAPPGSGDGPQGDGHGA